MRTHEYLLMTSLFLYLNLSASDECEEYDTRNNTSRLCAGKCLFSEPCQEAIRTMLAMLVPAEGANRTVDVDMNLTDASARWIIETARNIPDADQLLEKFAKNQSLDDPTRAVLLALYGALVIIGACGNALVVLSHGFTQVFLYLLMCAYPYQLPQPKARKPAMRTARNMFIVNLAVSDALVCTVVTPLTLLELLTKHWPLPDSSFLCKATGTIQAISIFVSTISITAIALDRYQLIVYPTRRSLQTMGAVFALGCIWLIAAALASPLFIYRSLKIHKLGLKRVETVSFCVEDWPIDNGRALYSLFSLIFQYVLPVFVVVIAHIQIHRKLIGRRRSTKRTPTILMAIAVTYVISWLPLNVFNLVADYSTEPILDEKEMLVTYAICHMFGMSSACSNPLLYGWLNENFRKEFEEMLCRRKRENSNRRTARQEQGETEMTVLAQFDHTTSNTKTSTRSQIF